MRQRDHTRVPSRLTRSCLIEEIFCVTIDQVLQPIKLHLCHPTTSVCELVISPPLIVQLWIGTLIQLLNQTIIEQVLDRSVQGCWPEPHWAQSRLVDILHNGITVPILIRQSKQNIKLCLC